VRFHYPFSALLMSNQALARDGYRCMVSGMFNESSLKKSATLQVMAKRDGANRISVHACHILSESTTQGIDPESTSDHGPTVNKVR